MKKKIPFFFYQLKYFILGLPLSLAIAVIACSFSFFLVDSLVTYNEDMVYPPGKDTYLHVGDGCFQISRIYYKDSYDPDDNSETKIRMVLTFLPEDSYVVEEIEPFCRKYLLYSNKLYVIGDSGYTVVDYHNHTYIHEEKIENLKEEYQKIFKLRRFRKIRY